jgi:hypothetical protein
LLGPRRRRELREHGTAGLERCSPASARLPGCQPPASPELSPSPLPLIDLPGALFLVCILLTCRFLRHLSYLPSATNCESAPTNIIHLLFQLGWGLPRTTYQPGHSLSPLPGAVSIHSLAHAPCRSFLRSRTYRQPDRSIAVQSPLRST